MMIKKKTESEKLQDELKPIDFKEQADKEQKELDESMKESFRQRDERKAREQGQIRPYTKLEEQILTAGLKDGEVKE